VFGGLDAHYELAEGDIGGLGAGGLNGSARVADKRSANGRLHGKILVGQPGERSRVVGYEKTVAAVPDAGFAETGCPVIVALVELADTHLRVGLKIILSHHPERCYG